MQFKIIYNYALFVTIKTSDTFLNSPNTFLINYEEIPDLPHCEVNNISAHSTLMCWCANPLFVFHVHPAESQRLFILKEWRCSRTQLKYHPGRATNDTALQRAFIRWDQCPCVSELEYWLWWRMLLFWTLLPRWRACAGRWPCLCLVCDVRWRGNM